MHGGRVQFDEHGIFGEHFRGDEDVILTHYLQAAGRLFQAQFDGHGARGFVDEADGVQVAKTAVGHLLKQGAGGAEDGGLHIGTQAEHESEYGGQDGEDHGVSRQAGGKTEGFMALDAVD